MSLTNVAYNPAYTWADPEVRSLESQMRQPLFNEHPIEMGLGNGEAIAVRVIAQGSGYAQQFAAAFPGDPAAVSVDHIIKAIAAFERTLISGRSAFDRYVFDDDRAAMPEPARRALTDRFQRASRSITEAVSTEPAGGAGGMGGAGRSGGAGGPRRDGAR